MSKKYDNNLQEIKETGTFATNTTIDSRNLGTLGVYFERDVLVKKVAELKQQLAEKDKEIERLKVGEDWYREQYNDICKRCEDYNKNLRHRVVEQFKEKYRNVANYLTGHCTEAQLIEILDQIEKGE